MADNAWRRPRQADIARLAGVSQATVSYVLNGRTDRPVIPQQTQERVLAAARELGYVANPSARSLAGGSNRLIGVYTFESVFPIDHHDFSAIVPEQHITISLGVAQYGMQESPAGFFTRVDEALYKAKANGRNRLQVERGGAADNAVSV